MLSNEILGLGPFSAKAWFMLQAMKNGRNGSHNGNDSKAQESFGARMARLRRTAGYSQRALAEELGISYRMVAYYEGETDRPPAHLLPAIAKALGVSVDQLLGLAVVSARKRPRNDRLIRTLLRVERLSPRARRAVIDHINALWVSEHAAASAGE
jgi:transcriptional regulator with XRE-family HTH domain